MKNLINVRGYTASYALRHLREKYFAMFTRNLSTKEKYGHIENKSEWTRHIYGFLDRVSR